MIIITGATGNVGRHLTEIVAASGHQVAAVSRGTSAPPPDHPGITSFVADLTDPDSLEPVLQRADALFLVVPGDGSAIDGPKLLDRVARAGVRRVVLLSSQAAGIRRSHDAMLALEDDVRRSGLEHTILRPAGFASNTLGWAPSIIDRSTVFAPFAEVALPVIDPLDIAEVAAITLTQDGHDGATYLLTGPEAITPRQQAAAIGRTLDRPIDFVELTREQALDQLLRMMPAPVAEGTLAILGGPTPLEQQVSEAVPKITGRQHSYQDWARRHTAAFGGSTPPNS
ncbi:NAD-dependent epimerase/dehydratase family protein [Microlunatus elymi]|uniref:NAD-dependent epimerase/dehydratase family protein n=1 Tax=Microlunatus elymi TaxID=2596828 RepID=A0A516PWN9_9ACTN|nr:NAD(P)H-binding protein [Microlunatus elymi]QDP95595.1 NAD-dependent epimerase/dehydratase family protein [Microlunatus elymi]